MTLLSEGQRSFLRENRDAFLFNMICKGTLCVLYSSVDNPDMNELSTDQILIMKIIKNDENSIDKMQLY